jgi:hypothetical protein
MINPSERKIHAMVYEFTINGRRLKSGDVISTRDGTNSIFSIGYMALGKLVPGNADHSILYAGPDGLCVEAGIYGVIKFNAGKEWNSEDMFTERGLMDTFSAASSVLGNRGLPLTEENDVRSFVRAYALGCVGKPYNINFLDPDNERALYCSQLVYLAYKNAGINLNVGQTGKGGKWFDKVVFPQEILDNSVVIPEE